MKTFPFNPANFRRQRLPWAVLLLLPSFAIDAVLIVHLAAQHPAGSAAGRVPAGAAMLEGAGLLLFNALLLKSWPIIGYFNLKARRRLSQLRVEHGIVIYRRRDIDMNEWNNAMPCIREYHLHIIEQAVRRRNGTWILRGQFEIRLFYQDGTPAPHRWRQSGKRAGRMCKKCVIPGYFTVNDDLFTLQ